MYVDKQGAGPPVVLIHGLGASSFSWRSTVAALSPRFTTYAVDLLGFGRSDAPAGFPYTMQAQADAVGDFMKKEGLSDPTIIGHSMGGGICLLLAAQAGKGALPKLHKMVVVAPVCFPPEAPPAGGMIETLSKAIDSPDFVPSIVSRPLAQKILQDAYAHASSVTAPQIDGYAKGLSSREQLRALLRHSSNLDRDARSFPESTLNAITTETLIVWGEKDPFLHFEHATPLARALPKASLKSIGDCGHIPQEERATETNGFIAEFLK